jgi:serine/threonine protein phosphatase 1
MRFIVRLGIPWNELMLRFLAADNLIWKPRSRSPVLDIRRARVPEGVRIYAVGDVHGRADLLASLFDRIDADAGNFEAAEATHVFLGDYVDRGPASREVIDLLIERGRSHPAVYLKGNHESYLIDFLEDPEVWAGWSPNGGVATLLSYGLRPPKAPDARQLIELAASLGRAIPLEHRAFLASLRPSFTCGDFFFVHAGVRPGVALMQQREEDLLWIREEFLLHEDSYEKLVVHGHTPVAVPDVRSNRINIDTGAYATGRLTCMVLERDRMQFI